VLECGNQSYSHVIALLDRYKSVFQVLCSTTTAKKKQAAGADAAAAATAVDEPATLLSPFDCQRLILHSLSEYWQHSVQHLIVVTEQLHAHGIISMQSVVAWVFFSGRHPERAAHLWKDVLFALLRKSLAKLQRDVDAVLHKPRAMAMATERRADDERAIESLLIERRELLVSCVANFQRLLSEVQKRDVHKEKDRARMEQDLSAIKQRFAQFARMVSHTRTRTLCTSGSNRFFFVHPFVFSFACPAYLTFSHLSFAVCSALCAAALLRCCSSARSWPPVWPTCRRPCPSRRRYPTSSRRSPCCSNGTHEHTPTTNNALLNHCQSTMGKAIHRN